MVSVLSSVEGLTLCQMGNLISNQKLNVVVIHPAFSFFLLWSIMILA